ncbi:DUF4142 domain-containing protein [Sulfitobacter pacificus]|uniref:Membrane protein n=1 Tax=Sulfitobacter pacificus TaxID=1499314 RepID=A0ABQ5VDQ0_9RHOB|nr:DUF4142 domain-containing protein [Sulfitobacter pacificus]GLQ25638.1 membrane protein [Sulfitobacter pacificus]
MKPFNLICCLAAGTIATNAAAQDGMNDLEIAHSAYVAGVIDIRYAHLAAAWTENPTVLEFATTMLRDHTAVNEAALNLLADLDVAPQDNDLSKALLEGAAAKREELAGLSGHDFDCAYATNELAYHQLVNTTVKDSFIPAVTVEPLGELLKDALATFRQHEKHAEMMVETLQCES